METLDSTLYSRVVVSPGIGGVGGLGGGTVAENTLLGNQMNELITKSVM